MKSKHKISIQDILKHLKSKDNCTIVMMTIIYILIDNPYDCLIVGHPMYLTTLSKHSHVNSNHHHDYSL